MRQTRSKSKLNITEPLEDIEDSKDKGSPFNVLSDLHPGWDVQDSLDGDYEASDDADYDSEPSGSAISRNIPNFNSRNHVVLFPITGIFSSTRLFLYSRRFY